MSRRTVAFIAVVCGSSCALFQKAGRDPYTAATEILSVVESIVNIAQTSSAAWLALLPAPERANAEQELARLVVEVEDAAAVLRAALALGKDADAGKLDRLMADTARTVDALITFIRGLSRSTAPPPATQAGLRVLAKQRAEIERCLPDVRIGRVAPM